MEKEKMSLGQLNSLKIDLEDKLEKLKEELLEVDTEIQDRAAKSTFKEMFESHINQFCKFTYSSEVTILCKIKEVSYDSGRVRIKLIASYTLDDYRNKINFWPNELDSIYEEQFLSGRVDNIIFYESLDEVKMFLKSIVDEQVK